MKKASIGFIWVLIAVFSIVLSACATQANASNPTAAPTQADTPVPAATTAPQATDIVSTPTAPVTSQPTTLDSYSDPFSYCAAVGTIDAPDARYTGDAVPDVVIQGYLKAAGLENNGEPIEILQKTTIWRCMDKSVYVCNFGANLPCNSKANTDKTPTQAMNDFCTANPDSDSIPMSVTGHSTIYDWHCVKDTPELLDQIDQVDAAGYLTRIWYQLQPGS